MIDFLLTPDIAYLLMVAALLLTLIAVIVPGTGAPEAALMACLLAAAYIVYRLGVNLWAVIVLALSIVPFFFALRAKRGRILLLVATFLLLTVGSVFLFTGANGLPLVNPLLSVIVSVLSGAFIWFSADRAVIAMQRPPVQNPEALIGKIGEARTAIHLEGSVQVAGELWSARSEKPIETRKSVRIVRREGLILTVEEESK
jgi:membrane-bound serine protease (ClpP class)